MKKQAFDLILNGVVKSMHAVTAGYQAVLKLPELDEAQLTTDQHELWKRLKSYNGAPLSYTKDSAYCDSDCDACNDLYDQNFLSAIEEIELFIRGRLTDAKKIISIMYLSTDRTSSVGCAYFIENEKPQMRYTNHEIQQKLQQYFNSLESTYTDPLDIPLPKTIGDYVLEESKDECTLFKEER